MALYRHMHRKVDACIVVENGRLIDIVVKVLQNIGSSLFVKLIVLEEPVSIAEFLLLLLVSQVLYIQEISLSF